jgi:hypothetical protein
VGEERVSVGVSLVWGVWTPKPKDCVTSACPVTGTSQDHSEQSEEVMTNRVAIYLGAAVLCAQSLLTVGCSSSTGATPGTGGTTGTSTGNAGSTGTGGAGVCDKGSAAVVALGNPCVEVKNKAVCDQDGVANTADDTACWNTCGPNKSGVKNCTCTGGMWSCPTCDYDITDPRKFDCYKTATAVACPPDPTDSSGAMLPASGGACTLPACQPCGSASVTSYRDSTGAPKAGWCICVPKTDGSNTSVYSCASVLEWAPQCQ